MYNDLFHIGKITIHGYGLMVAIGILAAVFVSMFRAKRKNMDTEPILDIVLIILIAGFLGGKILYLIVEWKDFISAENKWAYLGGAGFVVYGGIVAAIIVNLIYFKIRKKAFLPYFDLIMPQVSLAQGFGRIGCLLAGCCYGRPTASPIGITFPENSLAPANIPLYPTQIMMSIGNFIIAGILLLAGLKLKRDGQIASLYLLLYSVGRFVVEFYRNDGRGTVGNLSTSQFISILIFVIGVVLFVLSTMKFWDRFKKEDKE